MITINIDQKDCSIPIALYIDDHLETIYDTPTSNTEKLEECIKQLIDGMTS